MQATRTGQDLAHAEVGRHIAALLARLRTPLYAIVDSSHDHHDIIRFLENNATNYFPLFGKRLLESTDGRGPYLVSLSPVNGFTESLIDKSWGKFWSVYLTGSVELLSLRRHLARLVSVKMDDDKVGLFRFYDPRVLMHYLPTCTPEKLRRFFGPITSFYLESGDDRELLQFRDEFPCRGNRLPSNLF